MSHRDEGGRSRHSERWHGGRMRRGDVRIFLMAALLTGPAHGYELMQRIEEQTEGRWKPSPGSVYPSLQLLEEEGLVRSSEETGRKVYELTTEGRQTGGPEMVEGRVHARR